MSSGQGKTKIPFNKTIIRNGMIVVLNKDGTVRLRRDRLTGDIIKDKK
jgi:hypothetical protein